MDLANRVAIVTGASGGIGREISLALARRGARVALVGRKEDALNEVAARIRSEGGDAVGFPCDLTRAAEIEAMVAKVHSHYGRIDILVNSAFWGPPGNIEATTEEFWDQTLDTTLKAPFICARAVIPIFKAAGGGRIVNIGSKAGKVGEDNRTAYCAAKWGLEGLTAALATELLRYHIHVHLISPAATHTSWWEAVGASLSEQTVARMIPPQVVAEAVCWVVSQPDMVQIPDVPIYNYLNPFEGKDSPFEQDA